ncbi:MAG: S9 family peptidase [Chitinophagaceae bacterium]|nr:S9 family peptidase [Chitinophagaceae bacterium]
MNIRIKLLIILICPLAAFSQIKFITLEDIYKKGTFRGDPVRVVFEDEKAAPEISLKELKDEHGNPFGEADQIIYHPSDSGTVMLLKETEPIYRRSSKSYVYLYHRKNNTLQKLSRRKVLHPSFSPDGKKIAFVENNNLILYDIASGRHTPVTTDGQWNHIINGNCDWVYEEEFEFTKAYEWSPKGSYLAYYRFDESRVKEYNLIYYDNGYNKEYRYKYPKAGEDNSVVEIHIYDVTAGKTVKAQYEPGDIYIPRIKWTQDDGKLVVFWMNRHQNELRLLLTDAATGASRLLYRETNKYYIEIHDDWYWLKDGKHFLFTSEMNGFRHIYLYGMDGKTKLQISGGNYEVTEINGIDEKNGLVYYTMAYPRPMDRNLFVSDLKGRNTRQLTQGEYWHRIEMNKNFTRFYSFRSDINTPQTVTVYAISWDKRKQPSVQLIKTVTDNAKLKAKMAEYGFGRAVFLRIPNRRGDTLNAWMLKPYGFDSLKKYPVLFCNYGGPGSQTVANRYGAVSAWHQMMAQKGFIVVSVDNTGTGYRGEEFKKKTYLQLGKYEIEDQIDAARWLHRFAYVDKEKTGHWGWSYGGFMSSLAITKGHDVFSAAVAVAPVTSWRFYDNIYTERYMRTPKENPKGYDENSPIYFTDSIRGKYLIIHGTADDNVHFQNATQMISALVKSNIDFDVAVYPNKNHGISGQADNTTMHLWRLMTQWILKHLGNENTAKP